MQEKKKLSIWAKEHNMPYKKAWELAKSGELPTKIERNKKGSIFVLEEIKASENTKNKDIKLAAPAFVDMQESKASSRRNRAATITPTDQYKHIEEGLEVFQLGDRGNSNSDCISISEAVRLVRKAYWNFSELMNIINVMVEFSVNKIYWRGGNKKARDFFEALFNKIGILNLQEKFFLEYYRSCNVFPYRYETILKEDDIDKLNKTYGCKAAKNVKLPTKYIILDPASVIVGGSISFADSQFFQRLNQYEIQRLIKPLTDEDKNLLNSLPKETQKYLSKNKSKNQIIDIPLNPDYCYFIFYKKADYEPMAVPLAWPVLRDINAKQELKNIDIATSRTTMRAVLHISMGFESKEGEIFIDEKAMAATRALFESESLGKVLVTDFTNKIEWKIPEISKLLSQEKYKQLNDDIRTGLNNILTGGDEKFANQSIKVKLFIERLKQSREKFINEFLMKEVKRISKDMGFRSYPTPVFEDIDLKDEDTFNRIVARLAEIGILTPEELFTSMESGRLPSGEESLESQQRYKEARDKGLYTPLIGGGAKDEQGQNMEGRPSGSKSPQSTKKVKPLSASYSLSKIKDNLVLASELNTKIINKIKEKFNLKELSAEQIGLIDALVENIIISEEPQDWIKAKIIDKYLKNPDEYNEKNLLKVRELASTHEINDYLAAILNHSKIK